MKGPAGAILTVLGGLRVIAGWFIVDLPLSSRNLIGSVLIGAGSAMFYKGAE